MRSFFITVLSKAAIGSGSLFLLIFLSYSIVACGEKTPTTKATTKKTAQSKADTFSQSFHKLEKAISEDF